MSSYIVSTDSHQGDARLHADGEQHQRRWQVLTARKCPASVERLQPMAVALPSLIKRHFNKGNGTSD